MRRRGRNCRLCVCRKVKRSEVRWSDGKPARGVIVSLGCKALWKLFVCLPTAVLFFSLFPVSCVAEYEVRWSEGEKSLFAESACLCIFVEIFCQTNIGSLDISLFLFLWFRKRWSERKEGLPTELLFHGASNFVEITSRLTLAVLVFISPPSHPYTAYPSPSTSPFSTFNPYLP